MNPSTLPIETPDIETSSEDYARRFSGTVGDYFLRKQIEILFELVKPWPGARVLDVGGGHAQTAPPLVKAGFGVTVAGSTLECRRRLDQLLDPDTYEFRIGNLFSLPFEEKSFDLVLAFRLLPHLDHWPLLIAELCRLARKAVVVDYPDLRSVNLFSKFLFKPKKALEGNTRPFRCFHRRELLRAFSSHNFGQPLFRPEFFLPMALHRALNSGPSSTRMESFFLRIKLTPRLGSPVILRVTSR